MVRYIALLTVILLLTVSCSGGSDPETAQVAPLTPTAQVAPPTPTTAVIPPTPTPILATPAPESVEPTADT